MRKQYIGNCRYDLQNYVCTIHKSGVFFSCDPSFSQCHIRIEQSDKRILASLTNASALPRLAAKIQTCLLHINVLFSLSFFVFRICFAIFFHACCQLVTFDVSHLERMFKDFSAVFSNLTLSSRPAQQRCTRLARRQPSTCSLSRHKQRAFLFVCSLPNMYDHRTK